MRLACQSPNGLLQAAKNKMSNQSGNQDVELKVKPLYPLIILKGNLVVACRRPQDSKLHPFKPGIWDDSLSPNRIFVGCLRNNYLWIFGGASFLTVFVCG